ncbi:hypothetical protein TSST111916_17965 [Tsukamurella strandjordii]
MRRCGFGRAYGLRGRFSPIETEISGCGLGLLQVGGYTHITGTSGRKSRSNHGVGHDGRSQGLGWPGCQGRTPNWRPYTVQQVCVCTSVLAAQSFQRPVSQICRNAAIWWGVYRQGAVPVGRCNCGGGGVT